MTTSEATVPRRFESLGGVTGPGLVAVEQTAVAVDGEALAIQRLKRHVTPVAR